MKKFRVPCNGFNNPMFVTVEGKFIVIKGFEEFKFFVHRRVVRDWNANKQPAFKVDRAGWTVAGSPSGCAVPNGTDRWQREAIRLATMTLERYGKRKVGAAFQEAARLLQGKGKR